MTNFGTEQAAILYSHDPVSTAAVRLPDYLSFGVIDDLKSTTCESANILPGDIMAMLSYGTI